MPGNRLFNAKRVLVILLFMLILASSGLVHQVNAEQEQPAPKILFLNAQTPDFPSHAIFMQSVKEEMQRLGYGNSEYFVEYLGLFQYLSNPDYLESLKELLKLKATVIKPDMIMVTGISGVQFMLSYGEELFPGIPVICATTEFYNELGTQLPANYSGVTGVIHTEKTIELILKNHPNVDKIKVIIGSSTSEKALLPGFKLEAKAYMNRVGFEYLNTLSFSEILESVKHADSHTAVLYLFMYSDADRIYHTPASAVQQIANIAKVPFYGIYDNYLGNGIIGGYLVGYTEMGKEAAKQAIGFMQGNKQFVGETVAIPSSSYRFDWNELKRWHIKESSLPDNSILINKKPTLWDNYRWYIIGGLVLIALEAILVLVLLVNRSIRRKTERALIIEKDKAQKYLDLVEVMIVVLDQDAKFIMVNRKGLSLLGYEEHELLGESWFEVLVPASERQARFESFRNIIDRNLFDGRFERIIINKQGVNRLLNWNEGTLDFDGGSQKGVIIAGSDVTEIRLAEESLNHYKLHLEDLVVERTAELESKNGQLEEARASADAANNSKTEFLATMSHEIRTPMSAVIGLSYLLQQTVLTVKQMDYMEKTVLSARSLLTIIDDILDITKIEAKKVLMEQIDFDLFGLLNNVSKLISYKAQDKGLKLQILIHHDVPQMLQGDPYRLHQIIVNLAINAVKFTSTGGIYLSAEVTSENEQGITLKFTVRDTGIGISAEKQKFLFQKFSQAEMSTTRKFGGTGLGLVISKNLVELMGGSINVESEANKGSSFHFTAVFGNSSSSIIHKGQDQIMSIYADEWVDKQNGRSINKHADKFTTLRNASILLVDDNEINQLVAKEILEEMVNQVDVVRNGMEALEAIRLKLYDAILMDLQMPFMDGFETTRRIRLLDHGKGTPIIAISADAMKGVEERVREAGMNAYITKPIDPIQLFSLVQQSIQNFNVKVDLQMKDNRSLPNELSGLEISKALNRLGKNTGLYHQIIEAFQQNHAEAVAALREAVFAGNREVAIHQSRSLKGMALNIGGEELSMVAAKLQSTLQEGQEEILESLLQEIELQLRIVLDSINQL